MKHCRASVVLALSLLLLLAPAAVLAGEVLLHKEVLVREFVNTNAFVSNNTVSQQRLPPCTSLDIPLTVDTLPGSDEVTVFIVEYFPSSSALDPFVPNNVGDVSIEFSYGLSRVPLPPNSVINEADVVFADGAELTYVGSGVDLCEIDGNALVRGPGSPFDNVCAGTFYCNGVSGAGQDLWVRVSTSDSENPEGILFDLRVTYQRVAVSTLTLGAKAIEVPAVPAAGVLLYKPTVAQRHFRVSFPAPTTAEEELAHAALVTNTAELVVTVDRMRIGTDFNSTSKSQGVWTLTLNSNDLAVGNRGIFGGGYSDAPVTGGSGSDTSPDLSACYLANEEDVAFVSASSLTVRSGACVPYGEYYISVAMSDLPDNADTLYSFRVHARIEPVEGEGFPTIGQLEHGVPVSSALSSVQTQVNERHYALPRSSGILEGVDDRYLLVTVYNVNHGEVDLELTTGALGLSTGCSPALVDSCTAVAERCQIKLSACAYDPEQQYYITVQARNDGVAATDDTEFTVLVEEFTESSFLKSISELNVLSFEPLVGEEATFLEPGAQNFYEFALAKSDVTENHLLVVEVYKGQEVGDLTVDVLHDGYVCGTFTPVSTCQDPDQACLFTFNYCELLELANDEDEILIYFAVRNEQSTEFCRVDYTIRFTLYQAPVELSDRVTTAAHVFGNSPSYVSQQFRLEVPSGVRATLGPHDHIQTRVRIHNLEYRLPLAGGLSEPSVTLWGGCGRPAGHCPCYTADRQLALQDDTAVDVSLGSNVYADFSIPACECESDVLYISISIDQADGPVRASFELTPFIDIVRGESVSPAALGSPLSGYLFADNVDGFNLVPFHGSGLPTSSERGSDNSTVWYFDDKLYAFDYSGGGDNDELRVVLDYVPHRRGIDSILAAVVISRDTLPQLGGPSASDLGRFNLELGSGQQFVCGQPCFFLHLHDDDGTTGGRCSQVVRPCELEAGTYYMRVYAISQFGTFFDPNLVLDDYALDYSLTVDVVDTTPVSIAAGVHVNQVAHFNEYKHSTFTLEETVTSALVRVYFNVHEASVVSVYLSNTGPAGVAPCYSHHQACSSSGGSACDFPIERCGTAGEADIASQYWVSVLGSGNADVDEEGSQNSKNNIDRAGVDYTLVVEASNAIDLDARSGHPTTVQLDGAQSALLFFDITQEDVDAGYIFRLEASNGRSATSVSPLHYVATVGRDFCGGGRVFVDDFAVEDYACGLSGAVGRWYVRVQVPDAAEICSFVTVRAYFNEVPTVALPVQRGKPSQFEGWVSASLDFDEWVHFEIQFTEDDSPSNLDRVIAVEIADLTDNLHPNSKLIDMNAWLSFGSHGAPENSGSLISASTVPACECDSRLIRNNFGPENGTVMARFTLSECQCGADGPVYVTVRANLLGPEPSVDLRANFKARAYSTAVEVPAGGLFASLDGYRTRVLAGETFTFAEPDVTVQCDDRWGSLVHVPHYFKTLPLSHLSNFERSFVAPDVFNTLGLRGQWNQRFNSEDCTCGDIDEFAPECGIASCTDFESTDVFYGVLGLYPCIGGTLHTEAVSGQRIDLGLLDDRDYAESTLPVTLTANSGVSDSLSAGSFRHFILDLSAAGFNQDTSFISVQFSFTGAATVDDNVCFTSGSVGTAFPGTEASSYCPVCTPPTFATLNIDPCCADGEVYTYTVYGAHGGQPADFTISVVVTPLAESGEDLSLGLPLPVGAPESIASRPTGSNLYRFYAFSLTEDSFGPDDVVTFYVGPRAGDPTTRRVFIQKSRFAGNPSDSSCYSNWFDETCDEFSVECHLQIPACTWFANGGYGLYYLGIQAPAAGSGGDDIRVFIQRTETVFVGTPSSVAVAPFDSVARSIDLSYSHFKVAIQRDDNDFGLEIERGGLQITLARLSGSTPLQLTLRSSRNVGGSPLAGDPAAQYSDFLTNAGTDCLLRNDDLEWMCEQRDPVANTIIPGFVLPATMSTTSSVSELRCRASFCNFVDRNEYLFENAFIYVAVRDPRASTTRTPTSFTISAEYVYDPLLTTSASLDIIPGEQEAVQPFSPCNLGGIENGACHVEDIDTSFSSIYFTVPIGTDFQLGDYLTVNITSLTQTVHVAAFFATDCEPSVSTVCTPAAPCLFEFGSPSSGLLSFPEGRQNAAATLPFGRMYVRVEADGGLQFPTNTDFDIEILVQRPTIHYLEVTSSVTHTDAVWEDHYVLYDFTLPRHAENYIVDVAVTSSCVDDVPDVFISNLGGDFLDGTPQSSASFENCEIEGGHLYVGIRGGAVKYPGVDVGEPFGRVTPQTEVVVQVDITYSPAVTQIAPNTELTLSAGNYVLDVTDYGKFSHLWITSSSSVTVIEPSLCPPLQQDPLDLNTAWVDGGASCSVLSNTLGHVHNGTTIQFAPKSFVSGRYIIQVESLVSLTAHLVREDVVHLSPSTSTNGEESVLSVLPRTGRSLYYDVAVDVASAHFFAVDLSVAVQPSSCAGSDVSVSVYPYDATCAGFAAGGGNTDCTVAVGSSVHSCTAAAACPSDRFVVEVAPVVNSAECECDPLWYSLTVRTLLPEAVPTLVPGEHSLITLQAGERRLYRVDLSGVPRDFTSVDVAVDFDLSPSNDVAIAETAFGAWTHANGCAERVISSSNTDFSGSLDCNLPEQVFVYVSAVDTAIAEITVSVGEPSSSVIAGEVGTTSGSVESATVFTFNGGANTALAASAFDTVVSSPAGAGADHCSVQSCDFLGAGRDYGVLVPAGSAYSFDVVPVASVGNTPSESAWTVERGSFALLSYSVSDSRADGVSIRFTEVVGPELRVLAGCNDFITITNVCAEELFDQVFGTPDIGISSFDVLWSDLAAAPCARCETVHLYVTQNNPAPCSDDIAGEESTLFNVYASPIYVNEHNPLLIDFDFGFSESESASGLSAALQVDTADGAGYGSSQAFVINTIGRDTPVQREWFVVTGSTGFVHVGFNDFADMELWSNGDCLLDSCTANTACYVSAYTTPGTTLTVRLTADSSSEVLVGEVTHYNEFTQLSAEEHAAVLRDTDRHYYSIPATQDGRPQAVTLYVDISEGPPVYIHWGDRSDAILSESWLRPGRLCALKSCSLEVPTRADHTGTDNLYVWVSTADALPDGTVYPATHYTIRAFVGTENCVALPPTTDDFCDASHFSASNGELYRTSAPIVQLSPLHYRDSDAQQLYNRFLECRCPTATAACQAVLREFACERAYRECDADGFYAPVCRDECTRLEEVCGAFDENGLVGSCSCDLSEFSCGVDRYAVAEPCSGSLTPAVVPTPTPTPPTPDVEPTEGVVALEINFAGRLDTPAVLCSAEELQELIAAVLLVPVDFIEVVELEDFVAEVHVSGCCGRDATQLSLELINAVRGDTAAVVGTCLGSSTIIVLPPESESIPSAPTVVVDPAPPLTTSTGTDSTITLESPSSSSSNSRLLPLIINIVPSVSSAAPLTASLVAVVVSMCMAVLL